MHTGLQYLDRDAAAPPAPDFSQEFLSLSPGWESEVLSSQREWGWRKRRFFPLSSRLQSQLSKLITCSLLPPHVHFHSREEKGEKDRDRERGQGETQRGKGDCPWLESPAPPLGYQGVMATSARPPPHCRLALWPPPRSVEVKCSMPLSFPNPAVHRSLIRGWRHLGTATATKNYL